MLYIYVFWCAYSILRCCKRTVECYSPHSAVNKMYLTFISWRCSSPCGTIADAYRSSKKVSSRFPQTCVFAFILVAIVILFLKKKINNIPKMLFSIVSEPQNARIPTWHYIWDSSRWLTEGTPARPTRTIRLVNMCPVGSGQNIEKQNIESQNIERKISKAKYWSRKISKSHNTEVAEYRVAKYRMRKISK